MNDVLMIVAPIVLGLLVAIGGLALYRALSPQHVEKISNSIPLENIAPFMELMAVQIRSAAMETRRQVLEEVGSQLEAWRPELTQTPIDDMVKASLERLREEMENATPPQEERPDDELTEAVPK